MYEYNCSSVNFLLILLAAKVGILILHLKVIILTLTRQTFLLEDPDAINYKTETKETPLFFAVKNDHIECAELLLRWGANSEVLNLR